MTILDAITSLPDGDRLPCKFHGETVMLRRLPGGRVGFLSIPRGSPAAGPGYAAMLRAGVKPALERETGNMWQWSCSVPDATAAAFEASRELAADIPARSRKRRAAPSLYVYFDMDGVLVRFNETDSVARPFLVPGSGYFRNQPPDTKAVDLMRCLDEFPKVRTSVLTALLPGLDDGIAAEHEADKRAWCLSRRLTADFDLDAPGLPFACLRDCGKDTVLRGLPKDEDRSRHVLVDDDPANLYAWEEAGGTPVQYVQRKRTVSRIDRTVLTWDMTVPEMAQAVFMSPHVF